MRTVYCKTCDEHVPVEEALQHRCRRVAADVGAGGILSGAAIREAVRSGAVEIDPFDDAQVNPASYDLRLGGEVLTYDGGTRGLELRSDRENFTNRKSFAVGDDLLLLPGVGYLCHTVERVRTDKYVPVLDGKSSVGRLFVKIHETAGYGDPGFDGQYTLEVTCVYPTVLVVGMRVAQIRFHTLVGEPVKYEGSYVGETARGPVASRSWKQFKKQERFEEVMVKTVFGEVKAIRGKDPVR